MLRQFWYSFCLLSVSPTIFALCYTPLFTTTAFNTQSNKLEVSAQNSALKNGIYTLEGDAMLRSSDYVIRADAMQVDSKEKIYDAHGNVRIQAANIDAQGSAITVQAGDGLALSAEQIKYIHNKRALGTAARINITDTYEELEKASYTTCFSENPIWQFTADSIILNEEQNTGTAENASFHILGVNLFSIPKHSWILVGKETGLLAPSVSSYNITGDTGVKVTTPLFINLAPHYDLTLSPSVLSTRGKTLGVEYRHLFGANKQAGYMQLNAEYMGEDRKSDMRRWGINTIFSFHEDNFSLTGNLSRVSDVLYLKEVALVNTPERLESNLLFKYDDERWYASLYTEAEQLLTGSARYTKDSEVTVGYTDTTEDITYNASVIHTEFDTQGTQTAGARTHSLVELKRTITNDNISITPKVFLMNTEYAMDDNAEFSRTIMGVNIDSRMHYERTTELFGTSVVQSLTPRIAYFYNSDKNQSLLPNFDSERQSLTYAGLFQNSTWSGLDRVDAANTVAVGMSTDMISSQSGRTLLRASIGQNFNIDTEESSNIFAEFEASYHRLKFYNSLEYDSEVVARNTLVSVRSDPRQFVSVGSHLSEEEEYISLGTSVLLNGRSHIFASVKRAVNEQKNNAQTLGFVYEACCFTLKAGYFREYNSLSSNHDETTSIEFVFKGLGSNDSRMSRRIRGNIPEYIPYAD